MDEGAETDSSLVVETSRDEVQPKESAIGDDEMADSSISFLSDGQSASEVSLDKDISDIPFVAALSNSGTTNGDLDAQDQTLTDLSLLSSDQQSEREVARSASNEEGNAESDELSGISDPIQDLNLGNDEMRKVDSFTEPVGPDFDGPQNDAVDKDGKDGPSLRAYGRCGCRLLQASHVDNKERRLVVRHSREVRRFGRPSRSAELRMPVVLLCASHRVAALAYV